MGLGEEMSASVCVERGGRGFKEGRRGGWVIELSPPYTQSLPAVIKVGLLVTRVKAFLLMVKSFFSLTQSCS